MAANRARKGTIVFTALEVVTLVLWLILAGLPFNVSLKSVLAVVVLTVGLYLEHKVSVQVGAGLPARPFGSFPPDA
jgi:hypothetical protein